MSNDKKDNSGLVRRNYHIRKDQLDDLHMISKKSHIDSVAQIVRLAIDQYIKKFKQKEKK